MALGTVPLVLLAVVLFSPGVSTGSFQPSTEFGAFVPPDTTIKGEDQRAAAQQQTGRSRTGGRSTGGASGFFVSDSARAKRGVSEDSTWVVYLDSTARARQWKHVRRDQPQVSIFPDRLHPLFAEPAMSPIRREMIPDSTATTFTFRETVGGEDVKIPLTLSWKEYVRARQKFEWRKMLADEARRPKALQGKRDIGDVFSTFTKIQIPIPSNPIFSIFGKPEINLQISGAVDIRAGFRNTKSDQVTANILDQSRNEPDFNQEVQVAVNGTIGDKLNILADWNTQRTFEYENQLKIKYTGYDDEIVQSVEAGNVSLQTPSSFIGSSAALFGIKAKMQAGPFTLTTLASQKKGQIKEVTASGGAQQIPFEINAWNYATNYYFLDERYIPLYEPYYLADVPARDDNVRVLDAEVWVSFLGTDQNQAAIARSGVAYVTLPDRPAGQTNYSDSIRNVSEETPGEIEFGRFVRLDGSQFDLLENGYTGVLALNQNVQDNQIVAIAYRTATQQWGELTVNNPATADTSRRLVLKMIKPRNLLSVGPTYRTAWNRLLKNVYALGGRNIKEAGFQLDVFRRESGSQDVNTIGGQPLLRILGLDRYSSNGQRGSDNAFDFRTGFTINPARAEIIFPYLRPFDTAIRRYLDSVGVGQIDTSTLFAREIYDTTKIQAQQSNANKYIIKGSATGEASSKYQLGFNVVEGSVRVYENGQLLTPNIDYTVDYIVGEVVIRKASALVPGANLQIKYEQNDLFQLASKTLLGARGDLAISPTTSLGFTIMNLNQQTLSDKVRLGEEPNKNTIVGIDGQTTFKLPFLTSALDALPGIQTREISDLRISGEAAYMIPDPNTKKSTITSDNSAGIAYIDDFEGARRTIPFGVNYASWFQPSPPADTLVFPPGTPDSVKMYSKANTVWYTLFNQVAQTDVFPDRKAGSAASNRLNVMDVWYFPRQRGMYNWSPNLDSTLRPERNWGGIMRPISLSGTNFIAENINFIEIWMEVIRPGGQLPAKLYVDLGSISEDAIPNGFLNTEDMVPPSKSINNSLQPWEDVGLDMMSDQEELARFGDLRGDGDPSGDNWARGSGLTLNDFMKVNGTEGNAQAENGRYPDTEDLNMNGIVDRSNSYFRYEVSLDTVRSRNPRIVGGGLKGSRYYQFRIPIQDTLLRVGSPSFENIEFIRVMFQNAQDTIGIRIAEFGLVGNQWQTLRKEDTTMQVTVVGIEENSDVYRSPPGVIRERDKTRPDEDIQANEQSLSLVLKGLRDGESRYAFKRYDFRPLDLFNYKKLKMFVHGDPRFAYVDTSNYDAELFFRFGSDSLNYYEYRAPVHPASVPPSPSDFGWDPLNNVEIRFADLTAIKQRRDSVNVLSPPDPVPGGPPGAVYRVLGNPSLTQVRYMALGVTNPAGKGTTQPLVGEVWVNEMRVIDVDDTPGWAYRFDANLKLADLGAVSFNYSKVDPFFHALEQRFGSRQTGTNWALNANVDLTKFFPSEWSGTTLPISYSHSESFLQPRYLPNSDVLVSEAVRLERERLLALGYTETEANAAATQVGFAADTYRTTDTWAAPNFRIGIPSEEWWVRDTWNKLTFGFTYTRSRERSPLTVSRFSWQWNARIAYQLTLNPEYYFQPFKSLFNGLWFLDEYKDVKIWFAPQSFNWSFNVNRSRDVSLARAAGAQELITRNFNASRSFGFGWKLSEGGLLNPSGDYALNIESSWLNLETDPVTKRQRSFSRILDDIFFNNAFINFGQDTRYAQRNTFNTRPTIPNIFNIRRYFDVSFAYAVDYNWQNALVGGDLGKSAGWSNTINFTTNLKLKALFDPLFAEEQRTTTPPTPTVPRRAREFDESELPNKGSSDTTASPKRSTPSDTTAADTTESDKRPGGIAKTFAQMKQLANIFIKIPLLDYENISISFTQTNNNANSGVVGRPGFVNFWGRIPFFQDADPKYGPSRLYQLGLISDPHGRLVNFGTRRKFPFFGWDVEPGIRAPNGSLSNTFRQTNRLSLKTTRALWEGARLDLNWNVGWSFSSTETFRTNSLGRIERVGPQGGISQSSQGSVDRSFLSFPNILFLGMFKSDIKEVGKRYAQLKANRADTSSNEEKLAKAFEEGFEALPLLRKIFGRYTPRVNWTFRWDGLERLPMFAGFVSRLSFDHAYNSTYTRGFSNRPGGGGERTETQRVMYGFAPLFGLNFAFKELFKGNMGANLRYSTSTTYDRAASSPNIVETFSQEISITASYSRRGFEIPLFGLSLSNDLEVNATYSRTKNLQRQFEIAKLDLNTDGTPLEGSTRTTFEPRIKYTLSQRVNASVYYRLTKITPDEGSRIPGSTMNEAGLDIHISIQ
ncbi:MAG: cell surface protein SprA [Ignavibacteria bacterium]